MATIEGSVPADRPRPRRREGRQHPKLAESVRADLLAKLAAGHWRPGDRLPTEIELMEQYQVSRAPIREAMQSLLLMGIVEISPRRGATVRVIPMRSVVDMAVLTGAMTDPDRVTDVFQFRDATESAMAELSAVNADEAQLERIRSILEDNRAAVERGDREAARQIDVLFHSAIAEASGNVVFSVVTAALGGLLVELRRTTGGIPGASEASLLEHQEIFRALERRDSASARRATERQIRNTQARYLAAAKGQANAPEPPAEPVLRIRSRPRSSS